MSSARFIFAFFSPTIAYAHFLMMEPILAERLNDKGLTTMQIGLFFTIFPANYIVFSLLVQFIPTQIVKRLRMLLAIVLNCIAFLMVGPSLIFYFPDSLTLMCLG